MPQHQKTWLCWLIFIHNLAQSRITWEEEQSAVEPSIPEGPTAISVMDCRDWWLMEKGPAHCEWDQSYVGEPSLYAKAK